MNPRTIHETELSELLVKVANGVLDASDNMGRRSTSIANAQSLSKAASATTLVFPVLVSESIPSSTASMMTKAIERQCVSLMQLALSAYNITETGATNIVDFLKDFHTNADPKKLDLDSFIIKADSIQVNLGESVSYKDIAAVTEDCRKNINYYFEDDLNEKSLSEFAFKRNGLDDVVIETQKFNYDPEVKDGRSLPSTDNKPGDKEFQANREKISKKQQAERDYQLKAAQLRHNIDNDLQRAERDKESDAYKRGQDKKKDDRDDRITNNNYFRSQLLSSDVKKANELVPSMMIVNVMVKDGNNEYRSLQSVIGVKAKMYPVNPNETVTKIVTKSSDSNLLLKLVKVSTREISFFKDFLLAIDNAKIEALSKSKRGSSSKLFKVLERRAMGGKVRKILGRSNTCKPIFSLVISKEEADYMLNYKDVDVENPSVVIPIMEQLNLMYFVIVDESTETVKMLIDGDTEYETLSFSSLEKEVSDGGYKKIVNLVSSMSR